MRVPNFIRGKTLKYSLLTIILEILADPCHNTKLKMFKKWGFSPNQSQWKNTVWWLRRFPLANVWLYTWTVYSFEMYFFNRNGTQHRSLALTNHMAKNYTSLTYSTCGWDYVVREHRSPTAWDGDNVQYMNLQCCKFILRHILCVDVYIQKYVDKFASYKGHPKNSPECAIICTY